MKLIFHNNSSDYITWLLLAYIDEENMLAGLDHQSRNLQDTRSLTLIRTSEGEIVHRYVICTKKQFKYILKEFGEDYCAYMNLFKDYRNRNMAVRIFGICMPKFWLKKPKYENYK